MPLQRHLAMLQILQAELDIKDSFHREHNSEKVICYGARMIEHLNHVAIPVPTVVK